ncbi:hypothetical protein ABT297_21620 [Dactylosporangium sp. NPDC000555]|uniref:hypothetical protein n=1 Tax=Dactylosporangium sp. NPDC000555 TaxID=3154260 RepID=UPI003333E83A
MLEQVGAVLARPPAEPGQHTPRWANLWRNTDPIGGPVAADPPGFDIPPGDTALPRLTVIPAISCGRSSVR